MIRNQWSRIVDLIWIPSSWTNCSRFGKVSALPSQFMARLVAVMLLVVMPLAAPIISASPLISTSQALKSISRATLSATSVLMESDSTSTGSPCPAFTLIWQIVEQDGSALLTGFICLSLEQIEKLKEKYENGNNHFRIQLRDQQSHRDS